MRILYNHLTPTTQTSLLPTHRINQSVAHGQNDSLLQRTAQKDTVSISPQGKAASLIEQLTKQKMAITEQKNKLLGSAAEEGKSMDSIQSQLDLYDEQIRNLDQQIQEVMTQQVEEQTEKTQPKQASPKTKEEQQAQQLASITHISTQLEQAETLDTIKTEIDGDIRVLTSEIKLDKQRGMDTEWIAKKQEKLSDLQGKSRALTSDIGEQLVDATQTMQEDYIPSAPSEEDTILSSEEEQASAFSSDSEENDMILHP